MSKNAVLSKGREAKGGASAATRQTKAKVAARGFEPPANPRRISKSSPESDIDEILKLAAMRATDEYKLGQKEAYESIYEQFNKNYKETLEKYAWAFYDIILKCGISPADIVQHRIGLDPATGIPTVLSVISAKHEGKLEQLYETAYLLSYRLFEIMNYECQFWVITDHSLDQNSIDHDFPYSRKGK